MDSLLLECTFEKTENEFEKDWAFIFRKILTLPANEQNALKVMIKSMIEGEKLDKKIKRQNLQ